MDEVKFEPFQRVLVRDEDMEEWDIDIFRNIIKVSYAPYQCFRNKWKQCIPYDGNEHLFGTSDSPTPPERKFEWGDKVEVRDNMEHPWRKAIFVSKSPSEGFIVVCKGELIWRTATECRHADW